MTGIEEEEIFNAFRSWLGKIMTFTNENWEEGKRLVRIREVDKNTCLLKRNHTADYFTFVYSGLLKSEYYVGDDSYIYDFIIGPSPCYETISWFNTGYANNISLTTVTETILVEIPVLDVVGKVNKYFDTQDLSRMMLHRYIHEMMDKSSRIRLLSAEDRYRCLMNGYPDVLKYAKMEDIASYINVVPSSLSRIRKSIVG